MLKVKDSQPKPSTPTRTITVNTVNLNNGVLEDEDGPIIDRIIDSLPENATDFTVKVMIPLNET